MTKAKPKPEKLTIPIKLTPEQKAKIKHVTGNDLRVVNLTLEWLEKGEPPRLFIPPNPV
jgi:hypothetical protein